MNVRAAKRAAQDARTKAGENAIQLVRDIAARKLDLVQIVTRADRIAGGL